MNSSGPLHWHEGQFLQPHHFQGMQSFLLDQFTVERRLGCAYPYGVVEAKLLSDALENLQVRFDRLRVVMRSGRLVDVGKNAELPALDIKSVWETGVSSFDVFLGVPLWDAGRPNTFTAAEQDWKDKRIYRVHEVERADENTGDNRKLVQVLRINARLMLAEDDPTNMELLPLLRVARAAGSKSLPTTDAAFIPPVLTLSGSSSLREMLRDLADQVEASRKELAHQISHSEFNVEALRGPQIEQVLRLRTLGRCAARLPSLVDALAVTPFEVYLELRGVLAELGALRPQGDFEVDPYNHDRLAEVFVPLCEKIRAELPGSKTAVQSVVFVAGEHAGERMLLAPLTDEQLSAPNAYFLAVESPDEPTGVTRIVEDPEGFKLTSPGRARKRVSGMPLKEEKFAPAELPTRVGLNYYRVIRSENSRVWDDIKAAKAAAVWWQGFENSNYKLTLYMTMPIGKR